MKIKLLKTTKIDGKLVKAGEIVDVKTSKSLLDGGIAEKVIDEKVKNG